MSVFNEEFVLTFRDVDYKGYLTFHALVDYMQEIARNHADELGVNYGLDEDPYYWIVLRTKVELENPPMLGTSIRIETYIEGVHKMYSVRRFTIYNQAGEQIGMIRSYYLLMNKKNHLPMKLSSMEEIKHLFSNSITGEKLGKLAAECQQVNKEIVRSVYSGDIDGNYHMNNAYYIRWITDMFSTNELADYRIKSIQIQYRKEIQEDALITVTKGVDHEGIIHVIGTGGNGVVHFTSVVEVESGA